MEIQISDGIVRRVRGGKDAPVNGLAIQARTVANFLPLVCERVGASIVHNADANYTGIRFDTKVGPVVLEIPTGDRSYRLRRVSAASMTTRSAAMTAGTAT